MDVILTNVHSLGESGQKLLTCGGSMQIVYLYFTVDLLLSCQDGPTYENKLDYEPTIFCPFSDFNSRKGFY